MKHFFSKTKPYNTGVEVYRISPSRDPRGAFTLAVILSVGHTPLKNSSVSLQEISDCAR